MAESYVDTCLDAAKRYRIVDDAIAVLWKTPLLAESRFQKPADPERMKAKLSGIQCRGGSEMKVENQLQDY